MRIPVLGKGDFQQLSNANIAGWATIGTFTVPRAIVAALSDDLPWFMKLAVRTTFNLEAAAGRTTYQANLGFPFPDPAWLPTAGKVYAEFQEGDTVTASGVVSYNAAQGTVTANVTANAGTLVVDVLIPAGAVRFVKVRPTGFGSRRERTIWSRPVRVLADVDQTRSPQRWHGNHVLVQDWALRLELLSPYAIAWASPLTEISIPYRQMSLPEYLEKYGIAPSQLEAVLAAGW